MIGITGRAGSGKDSVARYLQACCTSQIYSFADPIKFGLAAMLQLQLSQCYDQKEKEKFVPGHDFTVRKALQTLGTEWGRHLSPDIWLNEAKKRFCTFVKESAPIVNSTYKILYIIPDVRFDNEAKWIKSSGGYIIKTLRTDTQTIDNAQHASEAGIDSDFVDVYFYNDYSLGALKETTTGWYTTQFGEKS